MHSDTEPQHEPSIWLQETPVLIEALAHAAGATKSDVCEHLEHNFIVDRTTDNGAVLVFLDEYILTG